jgi:hypothetical protein
MTEFLNFEPKDFQILEEIEFDERIQRPEKIRFFTLDEQVTDAFERMLPKGRVSRFQLETISKEVDKIRELYDSHIVPQEETYTLREPEYGKRFDWIFPVYSSADLTTYNWDDWTPLFEMGTSGHYNRTIVALPRPFEAKQGTPYSIQEPTIFVNEAGTEPIRALPNYQVVRTQKHEDGTHDIYKLPIEGTADQISFKGYYGMKRPVDIPNPLPDHPFLDNNKAVFVETTAPLKEIVPSLDAVLTHAVPVTSDPYGEGMKYLKIFDIQLSDIPWTSWKSRFPQAEVVSITPQVAELTFPELNQVEPQKELLKLYGNKYSSGLSARRWLENQIDAGELLIKMLLSEAGKNGNVNQVVDLNVIEPQYPDTTAEECALENIPFNEFIVKGLLRTDKNGMKCVPLEIIKQEKRILGYKNRETWKETTHSDILKDYLKALETFKYIEKKEEILKETKTPQMEDSEERKEVLAVLTDVHRFTEDKVRDLREVVKACPLNNRVYQDPIKGGFVVCEHTLAVLSGALDKNKRAFNDEWTALMNGYRVCKFCGENVVEADYLDQDVYDESGFKVRHAEAFVEESFNPHLVNTFTYGLFALKPIFDLDNPADDTIFLILSLIQVLPEASQTSAVVSLARDLSKGIPEKVKDAKRVKGIIGLAAACVLIQSHIPALIPRRSFGNMPLFLDGFPRDDKEPGKNTIVDTLMFVITKSFQASPTAFKGASADLIRGVINEKSSVRKQAITLIGKILERSPSLQNALKESKRQRELAPVVHEKPNMLIPTIEPPKELGTIKGYVSCGILRPFWTAAKLPRYFQKKVQIKDRISLTTAPFILPAVSRRVLPTEADDKEVRQNIKRGIPKDIKLTVGDDWRVNVRLATRLANIFQIPVPELSAIDPTENQDTLRDIVKSYLYRIVHVIHGSAEMKRRLEDLKKKDIALYVLLADVSEEEKTTNTLRAVERVNFIERLRQKRDDDRAVMQELLAQGQAPYVMTNLDRVMFATQLYAQKERDEFEEMAAQLNTEIGVGGLRDLNEQHAVGMPENVDNGDYGDYLLFPNRDGRDPFEQEFGNEESI